MGRQAWFDLIVNEQVVDLVGVPPRARGHLRSGGGRPVAPTRGCTPRDPRLLQVAGRSEQLVRHALTANHAG